MGLTRMIMAAAALLALSGGADAQRSQRRPVTAAERQAARIALDAFTRPTLTRFDSDAEFRRYVAAVRQVDRTSGTHYYSARPGPQFAEAQSIGQTTSQSDGTAPVCPPEQPDCVEQDHSGEMVVVTGSRIPPPSNPSITNNQMRGVEEGDIVKQIGHYLLVLQDGRIFVVDIQAGDRGAGAGRNLVLVDRADVYRNAGFEMWYDEMLVFGDRVLITGYSYEAGATEMAVFRLSEAGRLSREGVFRISSNDYYSDSNYSTRLVDGNLVTYTPLRIADMSRAGFKWPVVRRWQPEDDAREIEYLTRRQRNWRDAGAPPAAPAGTPLVDAAGIYRPVRRIEDPVVHTVSVCPLAAADARGLACRTTAFVGPNLPEWYVTERDLFLWTASEGGSSDARCRSSEPVAIADALSALVYRVPLAGGRPDLIAARGVLPDQFAIQADARNLYALVQLRGEDCRDRYDRPAQLAFFSIPLARFGPTLAAAPLSAFTDLPPTVGHQVASRFTDHYLVYGGLSRFRRYPDLAQYRNYETEYRRRMLDDLRPRPAYVVPIGRPAAVRALDIGHTIIRAERMADDIVLTGYRDAGGLSVTLIDLDRRPRVASTARLAGRYESEGRSHAFNSLVEPDGRGLMGLPTVRSAADSNREIWRSRASDLSFLELGPNGVLRPIGELERRFDYVADYDDATGIEDADGVPGYQCLVSCTDWYGNSRPIFTGGRIFGLSGTELIEGRIEGGRIREVQRLNIALSPPPFSR